MAVGDGRVGDAAAAANNVAEHQQETEDESTSSAVIVAPTTPTTPTPTTTRIVAPKTRLPVPAASSVYGPGIPSSTRVLTPAAAQAALEDAWEARAFEEDLQASNGTTHQWPPRFYPCSFCGRQFRTAQALGGHMNVHRRERAQANQLNTLRQAAGMDAVQFQPPVRLNKMQFQAPGLGPGPITCLTLADVRGGNSLPTSGTSVATSTPQIWLYQVPGPLPPLPANSNLSNVFCANTTVMNTQPLGDRIPYPLSHPFPHLQAVRNSYPFPESHLFAQQTHLPHMLPLGQQSSLPTSSAFPLTPGTSGQAYFSPPSHLWPLADHPRSRAEHQPEVDHLTTVSAHHNASATPKPPSPPVQSASNCPYSPNSPLSSPRPSQSSSSSAGRNNGPLSPSDSVKTAAGCSGQSRDLLVNYVFKKGESPDPAAATITVCEPRACPELIRAFQPSSQLAAAPAGVEGENVTESHSSDDGKRRRLVWRRGIEEHLVWRRGIEEHDEIGTVMESPNHEYDALDLELRL